jgi:hypothetical protein
VAQLVGVDDGADGLDPPVGDVEGEHGDQAGARPPRRLPVWVARLLAGEHAVVLMTEARGALNARAKRELGWAPAYPSWRQGFRGGLGTDRTTSKVP